MFSFSVPNKNSPKEWGHGEGFERIAELGIKM
jgi:hypothetical protein